MLKVAEYMKSNTKVFSFLRFYSHIMHIHHGGQGVSSVQCEIISQCFKNNYDAAFEIWTRACDMSLCKYGQPCAQSARFSRRCLTANCNV